MSDTVKLIIEISTETANAIKDNAMFAKDIADDIKWDVTGAIVNGTPLDDIKAEIEKLDEGITSYHNDKPWVYKSEVLEILNRIGKGE